MLQSAPHVSVWRFPLAKWSNSATAPSSNHVQSRSMHAKLQLHSLLHSKDVPACCVYSICRPMQGIMAPEGWHAHGSPPTWVSPAPPT